MISSSFWDFHLNPTHAGQGRTLLGRAGQDKARTGRARALTSLTPHLQSVPSSVGRHFLNVNEDAAMTWRLTLSWHLANILSKCTFMFLHICNLDICHEIHNWQIQIPKDEEQVGQCQNGGRVNLNGASLRHRQGGLRNHEWVSESGIKGSRDADASEKSTS